MLHDTFVEFNVYWIFKTVKNKKKKNMFYLLLSYLYLLSQSFLNTSVCFFLFYWDVSAAILWFKPAYISKQTSMSQRRYLCCYTGTRGQCQLEKMKKAELRRIHSVSKCVECPPSSWHFGLNTKPSCFSHLINVASWTEERTASSFSFSLNSDVLLDEFIDGSSHFSFWWRGKTRGE